jgi:hypothetical protein
MRALVLVTLLTGCTGEVLYTCPGSAPLGALESERPIDCAAAVDNVQNAVGVLRNMGIIPTGSDHDLERMTIVVQPAGGSDGRSVPGHDGYDGWYVGVTETAYLTEAMKGTFHEMLHHWQWIHGVINTQDHPGWCEKGWGPWNTCPGSEDGTFRDAAGSVTLP